MMERSYYYKEQGLAILQFEINIMIKMSQYTFLRFMCAESFKVYHCTILYRIFFNLPYFSEFFIEVKLMYLINAQGYIVLINAQGYIALMLRFCQQLVSKPIYNDKSPSILYHFNYFCTVWINIEIISLVLQFYSFYPKPLNRTQYNPSIQLRFKAVLGFSVKIFQPH